MSGCTGRCNQGRDCTCFQCQDAAVAFAAMRVAAWISAVFAAFACGVFLAQYFSVSDCDAEGSFRAFGAVYECSVKARP